MSCDHVTISDGTIHPAVLKPIHGVIGHRKIHGYRDGFRHFACSRNSD